MVSIQVMPTLSATRVLEKAEEVLSEAFSAHDFYLLSKFIFIVCEDGQ